METTPHGWAQQVARLHELLYAADDPVTALGSGCRWVRERTCADEVIVCDRSKRQVATSALPASIDAVRVAEAATRVTATAPIGDRSPQIGAVVASGRAGRVIGLQESVFALAAVAAPDLQAALAVGSGADRASTRLPEILGQSAAASAVRAAVVRASATSFPVLIEGESGTGKELVARALHRLSDRRRRRLCAVNCAALTDDLVEAELFGFARGAFTGALSARVGLFEEAHQGSLLLDEVAELSARAQAKLLRTLQEREVRRLGENMPRQVDVRVIAATNLPLADAVRDGRFRQDLLFRLAVVRLRLPALRERIDDVPALARAFWRDASRQAGKQARLGADAIARLCRRRWPGNVRELQNTMAALAVHAPVRGWVNAQLVNRVLLDGMGGDAPPLRLALARERCERQVVAAALARHAGRRSAAARELGLSRQGLTKAIRRLGLGRRPSTGVA